MVSEMIWLSEAVPFSWSSPNLTRNVLIYITVLIHGWLNGNKMTKLDIILDNMTYNGKVLL